jgi:Pentapeptide repeats (8 copies)
MTKTLSLATILDRLADRAIKDASVGFRAMVEIAGLSPAEDFTGASLQGLDFRDEDLRGFNFSQADLMGADFRRADIRGVNFDGAILTGAIGLDGKHVRNERIAVLPPPGFDIRKVKEWILGGRTIPESWIPFIVELDFSYEPLLNLEPLASLLNLHRLDLTKTLVENIAPLSNVTQLRELGLGDTKVRDISALQSLKQLQTLDLTSTKVESLEFLTKMPQLKLLFLLNSAVTEIESVSVIPGLCIVGSSALLHPLQSAVGDRQANRHSAA